MATAKKSRMMAITATESVFVVDLVINRVRCETQQRYPRPTTLIWV